MEIQDDLMGGLNPRDFLEKQVLFTIGVDETEKDSVTAITRKSVKGKEFQQLNLHLIANSEDYEGMYVIRFLFARDLKELRTAYTSDSLTWIGKGVLLSAKKEGDFFRWVLQPEIIAKEESVNVPLPEGTQ